ncbi:MAG: oxidoreductase [Solirubrobacteraceae bacterium]
MPHTTLTAKLGNHDVGRIGFGAMQLAGPGVFGPPRDRDAALAVLRRAIELGVDHIDTSQYYGPDVVNELIREALYPYPDPLRLVTKVGARRDDTGAWLPALRPHELRAAVEDNLRALAVEQLTVVNLRLLDDEPGAGDIPPLAEMLGALDDMRREGKLEHIGLSNVTRTQVDEALELVPVVGVQNQYSVLDRSSEDVLRACREHGLAFVPFFPLGSAFTGGPKRLAEDAVIARVAAKHGAAPSQVALAWLLQRDERILLIPGTSSVGHLEENLAAADVALDADDMSALEDVEAVADPLEAVHH